MKLLVFVLSALAVVSGAPLGSGPANATDIASRAPVSLAWSSAN